MTIWALPSEVQDGVQVDGNCRREVSSLLQSTLGHVVSVTAMPVQPEGSQSPHVRNWSIHMLMNCELGLVVSAHSPALGKFKASLPQNETRG